MTDTADDVVERMRRADAWYDGQNGSSAKELASRVIELGRKRRRHRIRAAAALGLAAIAIGGWMASERVNWSRRRLAGNGSSGPSAVENAGPRHGIEVSGEALSTAQRRLVSLDLELSWQRHRALSRSVATLVDSQLVSAKLEELSAQIALDRPIDFGF